MHKTALILIFAVLLFIAANCLAVPGMAGTPDPASGTTNVPLDKVLTWVAGSAAVSHDIYFGTDSTAVANAQRLAGDLNGNGRIDYNDLLILRNYWLRDPAGSVPYAGLNDDNIVNFNDFAILANNWKNQSNPCFKGNTASCSFDPNLTASTTYYWRIDEVGADGTVQEGNLWSFTTAAPGPEFTFVQASDPQMGWTQCGNMDYLRGTTISKINNINPAFVIVTGDLINSSKNSTQTTTYKNYAAGINSGIPIYTLPGNHDISEPSSATNYSWWLSNLAYPTGLANPWYSFTYNDSLFICLDSGVFRSDWGGKQAEEIAWLTQTLADANSVGYSHIFVFMHISLCLTSVNEAYMGSTGFDLPVAIRGQLLTLFHKYKVRAVFQGHYHLNAYVKDGDLEIITTSSCTCGLGSPPTTPGIQIIKVFADHIEHEYRTLDSLP
jgi:hypothetical protein